MTEPRPPIHPAENDWPAIPSRDYHNEIRAERDKLREKLATAMDAMRFVNTTFENDIAQGYVTKDKTFATQILSKTIASISDT
jgi:hypothetical protein